MYNIAYLARSNCRSTQSLNFLVSYCFTCPQSWYKTEKRADVASKGRTIVRQFPTVCFRIVPICSSTRRFGVGRPVILKESHFKSSFGSFYINPRHHGQSIRSIGPRGSSNLHLIPFMLGPGDVCMISRVTFLIYVKYICFLQYLGDYLTILNVFYAYLACMTSNWSPCAVFLHSIIRCLIIAFCRCGHLFKILYCFSTESVFPTVKVSLQRLFNVVHGVGAGVLRGDGRDVFQGKQTKAHLNMSAALCPS